MLDRVSSFARRNLAFGAFAAGASLLSRSASAQATHGVTSKEPDRIEDQIKSLQADVSKLATQNREMSAKIASADKRIAALEAKVGLHSSTGAKDQWNSK